jgi:hypothetical protein
MRGPVLVWSFWEGPGSGPRGRTYEPFLWAWPYAVGTDRRIYGSVDVEEVVDVALRLARTGWGVVCVAPLYLWGELRPEGRDGFSGRFARLAGRMAVLVHPAVFEMQQDILADPRPASSKKYSLTCLSNSIQTETGAEVRFFPLPVDADVVLQYLRDQSFHPAGAEGVPTVVGPVVGWRMWVVRPPSARVAGRKLRLGAVMSDKAWPVRRPMRARHGDWCWSTKLLEDPWALDNCRCGLYALTDPGPLAEMADLHMPVQWYLVVGAVALWGVVYRHERGYRAQYGYPQQPLVVVGPDRNGVRRMAEALSQNYGVQFLSTTDAEHALWLLAQQQQLEERR